MRRSPKGPPEAVVHHREGQLAARVRPGARAAVAEVAEAVLETARRGEGAVVAEAPVHGQHQHAVRAARLHLRRAAQRLAGEQAHALELAAAREGRVHAGEGARGEQAVRRRHRRVEDARLEHQARVVRGDQRVLHQERVDGDPHLPVDDAERAEAPRAQQARDDRVRRRGRGSPPAPAPRGRGCRCGHRRGAGLGDLGADHVDQGTPGDALHDLAGEPAEGEGVVGGSPPGLRRGFAR